MQTLTIGQLAQATGVGIETIRYYERKGIMAEAARAGNGRRIYHESDVKQLSFIKRCRSLGFTLKEIESLLRLVGTGEYTCEKIHQMTVQHVDDVAGKIADLRRIEQALKEMAAQCDRGKVPDCPIIESLFDNS